MGMLRLRFVGNRKADPAGPDYRYAVLVERARDHTFLDFRGWAAPAGPADSPRPPADWVPTFAASPGRPHLEMQMMRDCTGIAALGEVWWLDVDATALPDDDYYVYFYSITDAEMQYGVLATVVGGDDMSLAVRLKKSPLYVSMNSNFTGLPGSTGKVNVTASANIAVGMPRPS